MSEYWNQPVATARAFEGGWYRTGDEGHIDSEGYLFLVDRIKDMIVSGGENVYSIEVENAIATHPAVAQVAVIGIPDPVWIEQVHAIVVLRPGLPATEEEIKEHVRGLITGFKVPKSVEFRAEPIPLSGALKPLKRELREPFWRTPLVVGPHRATGSPPPWPPGRTNVAASSNVAGTPTASIATSAPAIENSDVLAGPTIHPPALTRGKSTTVTRQR